MSPIRFPHDPQFISNLVLQRTEPFMELGGGGVLSRWFEAGDKTALHAFLAANDLLSVYLNNVAADVAHEVRTVLQQVGERNFNRVASIGPGNGLFELALFHARPYEKILLIDIEHSEGRHQHGYAAQGSGYASLAATKRFMTDNGVPAERIELCNPQITSLPDFRYDLLVSLLSMGFHYPCDDYVDFILSHPNEGASVVLDKRKDAADAGFKVIREKTTVSATIDAPKHSRYFLNPGDPAGDKA